MVDGSVAAGLAEAVGAAASASGRTVAVAESLTGGALSAALAIATEAGEWFAGGVVAYRVATKHRVLGVTTDDVVTARCAIEMARGVRELLGADVSAAVTGVGGPDPQDGHPAGQVFIAVASADGEESFEHRFDGEPDEVVRSAIRATIEHLRDAVAR